MRQDTNNRKFCVRLAVRADPQHTREPTPTCIWSYGSSSSDCSSSCEGIFSRANTCEQVNGMGSNCLSVQSFVSPSPQQNTLMVAEQVLPQAVAAHSAKTRFVGVRLDFGKATSTTTRRGPSPSGFRGSRRPPERTTFPLATHIPRCNVLRIYMYACKHV